MLYRQEVGWIEALLGLVADPDELGLPILDGVEALLDAGDPELVNRLDDALRRRQDASAAADRRRTSGGRPSPDLRYLVRIPRQPGRRSDAA